MRLCEIHIRGFKSIVDQSVSLDRVNCVIGTNGFGKSNVLEALGAAAGWRVDDEVEQMRGQETRIGKGSAIWR